MDLVNPNYNDFFIYGFCYGRFKYYDVKEFLKYEFADAENPREGYQLDNQAKSDLQKLQILIGEKYISKIFPKYEMKNFGMWEGVDDGSKKFHNDQEDGKIFNSNFLIYLDSTLENYNGIQIKNSNDEIYALFPSVGDFVWLNQSKRFQHKASHNDGRRRLLSFEYYIDGLNN